MIVHRVKALVERLLAMGAKIALAPIRSFSMLVGARMTAEQTFHNLYVKVAVSLLYSTHHSLTHYQPRRAKLNFTWRQKLSLHRHQLHCLGLGNDLNLREKLYCCADSNSVELR
jgi:hypothetical protein